MLCVGLLPQISIQKRCSDSFNLVTFCTRETLFSHIRASTVIYALHAGVSADRARARGAQPQALAQPVGHGTAPQPA